MTMKMAMRLLKFNTYIKAECTQKYTIIDAKIVVKSATIK